MMCFTQESSSDAKPKKGQTFMIIALVWLILAVISVSVCVLCFCLPTKYTKTTDIGDYGIYTGTNDDAFTQNFINSFFPVKIAPTMDVVKYSYRAENADAYGFEAYLEINIRDQEEFEDYVQSIAPTEKWESFTFDEKYMEYNIENVLDISIQNPDGSARKSDYPIECARIRKVLYCAKSQSVIFVAIGVYDGGGVRTNYLCTFFDRFDIDPIAYENAADSP